MPNKMLILLQSLISCFLKTPRWTGEQQWVQLRDSGEATPRYVPKSPLSAEPQKLLPKPVGSSVLIFFVPRIRPMKTVSTDQVFSRFPSGLWRGFLSTFFPLFFPPVLQILSPSMPLLTKYWSDHHLSISEGCAWNHLAKIGTQIHVAGTLCYAYSVKSDWDLSPAKIHDA